MKNIYILLLLFMNLFFGYTGYGQAQQYYVGLPVYDTLHHVVLHKQSNICAFDVFVDPNLFSVSGVDLYLVIDSLNNQGGSVFAHPYGKLSVGDSLPLPSSHPRSGYEFIFTGGDGSSVYCRVMAQGTPTTLGQAYLCDDYTTTMSETICQNTMILGGTTSCNVQIATQLTPAPNHPKKMSIYPNPTSGVLNIENIRVVDQVVILDLTGETVSTIVPESNTIDLSKLPKGIYFIQITDQNKTITHRFAKY